MDERAVERLVAQLGSPEAGVRREAAARLFDPLWLDDVGHLRALLEKLPELVAAAGRLAEPRLFAFVLDALQAVALPGALVAALSSGGPLTEALRGLPRPLPLDAASPLLGLPEKEATGLLRRLYPGRDSLTPGQVAAAARLPSGGGLVWLAAQRQAWRTNQGRAVPEALLPLVLAQPCPARAPANARLVQAPGLNGGRLGLVRALIERSAAELSASYRLAARLSAALAAPVITLHNATLGGFSAWGVPGFHLQAPESGLAGETRRLAARIEPDGHLVAELLQRRLAALIRPRLEWLLSALRTSCLLEGDTCPYDRWLARAEKFLGAPEPPGLAFPFRPRLELEARLAETLALAEVERAQLPEKVVLLAALWLAGRRLMAAGRLKSLVIPVADKFIASSSRGKDVAYLAATLRLLQGLAPEARCLLFDASPNPNSPSLRHAPSALDLAGVPALGLGIFSQDGARPRRLRQLRAHPDIRLFLLEPLPCAGRRGAERLSEGDPSLLSRSGYDPAWKEGLGWLTAGTRLAELADPWLPAPPGERVLTTAGPLPGGRFYRLALRRRLGLAEPSGRSGEARLWRRWAELARLE